MRPALSLIQIQGLCTHPCSAVLTEHSLWSRTLERQRTLCQRQSGLQCSRSYLASLYSSSCNKEQLFSCDEAFSIIVPRFLIVYLTLLFILLAHWHSNVYTALLGIESKIRFSGTSSTGFYVGSCRQSAAPQFSRCASVTGRIPSSSSDPCASQTSS